MLHPRDRFRLGAKARLHLRTMVARRLQHLEGDDAAQTGLSCIVDDAHRAVVSRSRRSSRSGAESFIVLLIQSQLARNAADSAIELLAQRVRPASELGGDLGPFLAQAALIGEMSLLGGHAPAKLVEQIA